MRGEKVECDWHPADQPHAPFLMTVKLTGKVQMDFNMQYLQIPRFREIHCRDITDFKQQRQ